MIHHSIKSPKKKSWWGISNFAIVFTLFVSLGLFPEAHAGSSLEVHNLDCSEKNGPYSVFYKFDRIVVWLSAPKGYPPNDVKKHPSEFLYDSLQQRIENSLEKGFSQCLKTWSGKKPIEFYDWRRSAMYDDDSLVFFIKLLYPLSYQGMDDHKYALLLIHLYRTGLSPENSIAWLETFPSTIPIYLSRKNGQTVAEQLDNALKILTPAYSYGWRR